MSVDGTDCRIYEPSPFSPVWYSHKFKGPALRYEVGVGILNGDIVWVHGPFPCGSYTDLNIFRLGMKDELDESECVLTDLGYGDERCKTKASMSNINMELFHSRILARHENVNRRLKQFSILSNRFRNSISKHSVCFHAVANITQLMFEENRSLFECF